MNPGLGREAPKLAPTLKPLTGLDLLYALIHELSQPLTVLMGEFELASLGSPEVEEYKDLVDQALVEINHAASCVTLFSKLAVVPPPDGLIEVPLNGLLTQLCDAMSAVAEARGSRIQFLESSPVSIRADNHRLELILSRLMHKLLELDGQSRVLTVSLEAHPGIATVMIASAAESRKSRKGYAGDADSEPEAPTIHPKDPDWVLGQWVAESSGGSFHVTPIEDAGLRVTLSFPISSAAS